MAPGLLYHHVDRSRSRSPPEYFAAKSPNAIARSTYSSAEDDLLEPLAVIGFSLKFPEEATSPEAFWQMLVEKRCAMTEIPKDRINIDAFYSPDKTRDDTIYPRGGHFLKESLGLFDAPFFSITSAEAAAMDVQQRTLLETAYRALENAGIPLEKANGSKTSVHTGSFTDDYRQMVFKDNDTLPKYAATGVAISILANRLSWFFNLTGPSIHLDSACSSSMMALDMACQGLRNGDADMALVAGASNILGLEPYLFLGNMGFLSPDSRCWSFDSRANGYARGEGCGVVVIKRLSDALRDGDTIRGVIRSTGSNSDGRTPGITQPSAQAQEILIRECYEKAGLDLGVTRFFEAHGTGTAIGDPIEVGAIGAAFSKYRSPEDPLYIGAVKSNIGHLEGASGIAGLIKTIICLEKGVIPPNTNFEKPNPKIDAPALNIRFPLKCVPWPENGLRRASVNSFGFGGSNSHAVIDDAYNFLRLRGLRGFHHTRELPPSIEELSNAVIPPVSLSGTNGIPIEDARPRLLVWSAADEGGLSRLEKTYSEYFKSLSIKAGEEQEYFSSLAYTLAVRRSAFPWKSFAISTSIGQLQGGLRLSKAVRSKQNLGLAYIFTGQGAQYAGMGRDLMAYPVYKTTLQMAEMYLEDMGCPWSLIEEMHKDKSISNVNRPEFSQPLCTALQIALIELLRSFNITPAAVVGHSSGEIAAAYCMGALSLRSACKVAYFRGKLSATMAKSGVVSGAMIAVGLSELDVRPYIQKVALEFRHTGIVVACVNSPKSVTVSGDQDQVDALKLLLDADSVFARKLLVDVAYHSQHMERIAGEYLEAIEHLEPGTPLKGTQTMVSSVTGRLTSASELSRGEYWVRNLTSPVRFSEALGQLASSSDKSGKKKLGAASRSTVVVSDLLELGPHSALQGPAKDILKITSRANEVSYCSALTRNVPALETTLTAIGKLYCLGYPVEVANVNEARMKITNRFMALPDLPEYPFDHSQNYWHESRLSKEFRLRTHPRHDLIGTRVSDWNPLEARWRNVIKISQVPWVEDHQVNGNVIYPAAGMLVMAIEGARQLADPSKKIVGYRIKNATFQKTLNIPSNQEGADVQIYIRPVQDAYDKDAALSEFRICTFEDDTWSENCRGTVQLELEDTITEVDVGKEAQENLHRFEKLYETRQERCADTVDSETLYEHLKAMGLSFGPSFRTLSNVSCNAQSETIADIAVFQWKEQDHANYPQPHVVHPTTLDALIQLCLVGLTQGGKEAIPTTVPTRITNLWLSASGLSCADSTSICASSHPVSKGYRQTESAMFAVDKTTRKVLASVDVLETTNISQGETDTEGQSSMRQLCYNMDWKPDVDFLEQKQADLYFEDCWPAEEPRDYYQDLAFFLFASIKKTLQVLGNAEIDGSRQQYVRWMERQVEKYEAGTLLHARPEWSSRLDDPMHLERLHKFLETSSSEGKFYTEVARHLVQILKGEVDPLNLLFQGDLAKNYYLEINARLSGQFIKLMDLLAHKTPGLKALEIGAGTGGTTAYIIKPLMMYGDDKSSTPRCSQFDFTDISPAFFEGAKEDFKEYSSKMQYKVLDIECDVSKQGYEKGTYDLIVAANVLHATKHMDVTLKNVHALLKPGGKLVLLEGTGDFGRSGFSFGLLPGWWLSTDDYREWGPTMTPQKWDRVLGRNGFSGVDLVLSDYRDPTCQELSIMVSTSLEQQPESVAIPKTLIVVKDGPLMEQSLALQLQDSLKSLGSPKCEVVMLARAAQMDDLAERFCIFLTELHVPLLHNLDEDTFNAYRSVLSRAKGIVWANNGGGASMEQPDFHIAQGLLRTLRTENGLLKAVTLSLESTRPEESHLKHIMKVVKKTLFTSINDFETEYIEENGMLCANRIVEANHMNLEIQNTTATQKTEMLPFGAGPALALNFETPGLLDSLRFLEDKAVKIPLASDEVEIEVTATGVNFMDCLTALGRINQTIIGAECAGIVTRVGSETADLKPGDRVCGVVFDCFKSYARTNVQLVMKIPDGLSFAAAAGLPCCAITAYHSLVEVARLQKGESVLIHAAAGGTGQAAVQIAQHIGAEVFVTVSSERKKKLLIDHYGIQEDHIFYSRNTTFAQGIMRVTNGHGVDVVLNSLAGKSLVATWECMASFGRFVEIGKRDIHGHSSLPMKQFARNVSFSAVDLVSISKERPAFVRKSLEAVLKLTEQKKVQVSQPLHTYSVSDIEDAFRYMQSGKNIGKIVIEMRKEDKVLTVLDTKPSYYFEKDATYLIAGGFGGVARASARWMARRGAKNLLLLSRSGARSEQAAALVEELQSQGVRVEAPACDVTNFGRLEAVLNECKKTMPPVKGCIQGAMVLKDIIFEKMTFPDWDLAIKPKVQGSWNLHRLLPNLDFFIMLSSLVGIHGSGAQANYAAGSTYLDALARHRVSRGQKAVSIDLGWMQDEGIIAESEFLTKAFAASGIMMPIATPEFVAVLDHYCNPSLPIAMPLACQTMVGLATPASLRAKGTDVPALLYRPMFRYMHHMGLDDTHTASSTNAQNSIDYAAAFAIATSLAEAGELVVDGLSRKLSKALSIGVEDIETSKPLHAYGVDSLLSVELRSWFAKEVKADVAVFEIMGGASMEAVGRVVAAKSAYRQPGWTD
ncbi:reducing type I polyketide synthase [Lindgomyces ingoldianus]|uniref:Reducing type I polyketide synthase n=1 Tax=Lindgomyces ingoldianus TaxID=673940 RepID=A0ACB6QNH5_9PLEO|nr:reducing type I polyketide synthase [Lindgomyces ingoldianus]KAF2468466.1 reducing type I polyketide synthase [Lindgomyces ingoldianus]